MKTKLNEIDALIISNLANIDAAANRLNHEIANRVVAEICSVIDKWRKKQGWLGESDWDDIVWVAAPGWVVGEARIASFALEFGADDTTNNLANEGQFDLTRICGIGTSCIGFRWYFVSPDWTKKAWKSFIRPYIEELRQLGLEYEDGGQFFLKWSASVDQLAQAYQDNSISDALQPLCDALEVLVTSQKLLGAIVQKARRGPS